MLNFPAGLLPRDLGFYGGEAPGPSGFGELIGFGDLLKRGVFTFLCLFFGEELSSPAESSGFGI